MCRYIILIAMLFFVGCSSFDFLDNQKQSEHTKENKSIILDDEFFGKDFFVFADVDNKKQENTIDEKMASQKDKLVSDPSVIEMELLQVDNNISGNKKNNIALENIIANNQFNIEMQRLNIFNVTTSDSLKEQLGKFLNSTEYKLIWETQYDVIFENDVSYESDDVLEVLKSISNDLSIMGIDIHINVYLKNKVVLVYSVRS